MKPLTTKTKRICLFADYNAQDKIDPCVIDYLKELAQFSDIYYLADCDMSPWKLRKLKPYVKKAWATPHGVPGFGSYSLLAKEYVGWDVLTTYDELLLVNDSMFCINSLQPVFEEMKDHQCGFWGLQATDESNLNAFYRFQDYMKKPRHERELLNLGSYFLCLKKNVLKSKVFQDFLNNIQFSANSLNKDAELLNLLVDRGYTPSVFIPLLYFGKCTYSEQAFRCLNQGMPLIKRGIFTDNPLDLTDLDVLIMKACQITQNKRLVNYLPPKSLMSKLHEITLLLKAIARICLPRFILDTLRAILYRDKLFFKKLATDILPPGLLYAFIWLREHSFPNRNSRSFDGKTVQPGILTNRELLILKSTKKLMVFFNVSHNIICGGMLSINRFVAESLRMKNTHDYHTVMSGIPLGNEAVDYDLFQSACPPIRFVNIIDSAQPDEVILYLPELYLEKFLEEITTSAEPYNRWLKSIKDLHITILKQNQELMPDQDIVSQLKRLTDKVTITAAHVSYATQYYSNFYNCPLSLLTPFKDTFYRTDVKDKEKIIVFSPDPLIDNKITKEAIVELFTEKLPEYKIVTVCNISLEDYKKLISKAKYTITFGEGYDGYFIQPYYSNSISFAVYNTVFFPAEFQNKKNVYPDWEAFYNNIVDDIMEFDSNDTLYQGVQEELESTFLKYTNRDKSLSELSRFLRKEYDFFPQAVHETISTTSKELA